MVAKERLGCDEAIRERMTTKVMATQPLDAADVSPMTDELLALAGMAPFHRACDELHRSDQMRGIEPWRVYSLNAAQCRWLRGVIPLEAAGKIPRMLAAADALFLCTWLPNPPSDRFELSDEALFEPTLGNMEHIAAASAAIQNLLIAATARNVKTYWSSGGVLRSSEVFRLLQIPDREILLGAIFLFPTLDAQAGSIEVVGSKLRSKRSPISAWCRAAGAES